MSIRTSLCPLKTRRGAILPLVALLLPVMLILACFAVNVAYMELTRTELRIASDSATRAAAHALMTTGDTDAARTAARAGAQRNLVAGQSTRLADGDILFGTSTRSRLDERYQFNAGGPRFNAVNVNLRRDAGSLDGAVNLIMPTFGAVDHFGPIQSATSTQVELDVALVLDRSGSMAYGARENSEALAKKGLLPTIAPKGWKFGDPAPPGSRWLDLVDAVNVFQSILSASPQDEFVSLSTYSSGATLESGLSGDFSNITTGMGKYTNKFVSGGTNISSGLVQGINALSDIRTGRPWAVKVIIVMTDGRHNIGVQPDAAARDAYGYGVTVYTVSFSDEADKARMKNIADIGGGKHIHATSAAELRAAFGEIARRLPMLLTN